MGHDERVNTSESNLRQAVEEGVARMWARRREEQELAEAATEYPEMAAREMLVFAIREPNVSPRCAALRSSR